MPPGPHTLGWVFTFLLCFTLFNSTWANGCSFPPPLDHAQPRDSFLDRTTFSTGSTVSYMCQPGYSRVPGVRSKVTCMEDGTWSTPGIFCMRRSCGDPGKVENAEMMADDFLFGSNVTYVCNLGYRMVTKMNSRECQADGTWSDTPPICEAKTCPYPHDTENTQLIPKKIQYQYGDNLRYWCTEGYKLTGEANTFCNHEGIWTPDLPSCKAVCEIPPERRDGEPVETFPRNHYFFAGTSLKYKCRPGYIFPDEGNYEITCGPYHRWSEPDVSCERRSCDHPGDIPNAKMTMKDLLFESNVFYTCNPGYTMISSKHYRTCEANGTWSGSPPVCKESICDTLWAQQVESGACTSNPDVWIKNLQVQYLYLQIEDIKLEIDIKKKKLKSAEEKQENKEN